MGSLIEGYEYDIFISYRHNDNRSGWVTEFIKSLQEELAATLKDPVSIYFDNNTHDGLLETHHVDKTLEGKLKCLIFIPILSQTYCDPKSFAWQHEFIAFNNLAKEDQFGRDIKLNNGNVASRILPLKIHNLDADDKSTIENEIGGVLRAIEFIFKTAGVNRPLRGNEDHPNDNQNKIFYRDQINKVANAIKEIIGALKNPTPQRPTTNNYQPTTTGGSKKIPVKKISIAFAGLVLFALVSFFIYNRNATSSSFDSGPRTIAVIPFANLSAAKEDEYFADGVCNEILTQLSKIGSLNVISRTSMLQFKNTNKTMKEIGEAIGADVLLEGSIQKSNDRVHITVQLFDAKHEKQLWADSYDKEFKDIFSIQSDVAQRIASQLKANLTSSEKAKIEKRPTTNMEAYNLYLKGNFEIAKVTPEGVTNGFEMFNKAIQLDPEFALPYIGIAYYYGLVTDFYLAPNMAMPQMKIAAQTALAKDSTLAAAHAWLSFYELWYTWNWEVARQQSTKAIKLEPNGYLGHLCYSWYFASQGNLDEAKKEGARMVELEPMAAEEGSFYALTFYLARQYDDALHQLDRVRALDSNYPFEHFVRGQCYLKQGKFKEGIEEQQLAHKLFSAPWSYARVAYAYAVAGKTQEAISILDSLKTQSATVYVASDVVASVYVALGDKDRAFEYLEKAIDERAGWLLYIKVDPIWDPLRKDERFIAILKKMGLAYYSL